MNLEQLSATVDQLVRRARYLDELEAWTYEDRRTWKEWKVKVEALRAAHGVVPFPVDPAEEPKPAEPVRYFAHRTDPGWRITFHGDKGTWIDGGRSICTLRNVTSNPDFTETDSNWHPITAKPAPQRAKKAKGRRVKNGR